MNEEFEVWVDVMDKQDGEFATFSSTHDKNKLNELYVALLADIANLVSVFEASAHVEVNNIEIIREE